MHIVIEQREPEGLRTQVWRFAVSLPLCVDQHLVVRLDGWSRRSRDTKRHRKWRTEEFWDRRTNRNEPHRKPAPVVPGDVKRQVLDILSSRVACEF